MAKIKKAIRFFLKGEKLMPTIMETPVDPKTGNLIWKRTKVLENGKVAKGQHTLFSVFIKKTEQPFRDMVVLREVLA